MELKKSQVKTFRPRKKQKLKQAEEFNVGYCLLQVGFEFSRGDFFCELRAFPKDPQGPSNGRVWTCMAGVESSK